MNRLFWTLVMMALLYGLEWTVGFDAIKAMGTGRFAAFMGLAVALNLAGYFEARTRE